MSANDTIHVEVIHLSEKQTLPFPRAVRVADLKANLSALLSIPEDAKAYVNGRAVTQRHVIRKSCSLEFRDAPGEKGGDFSSEADLLRRGYSPALLKDFCECHSQGADWHAYDGERYYRDDAITFWLRSQPGAAYPPRPTLDDVCQEALNHFEKTTPYTKLSLASRFYIVAGYWNRTEGLTPAKIRDKFRKLDSPDYPLPADNDSAWKRAKTAIRRGKDLLTVLK